MSYEEVIAALAEMIEPPCEACRFSLMCANPAYCEPYQIYIENGVAVSPPNNLPMGE